MLGRSTSGSYGKCTTLSQDADSPSGLLHTNTSCTHCPAIIDFHGHIIACMWVLLLSVSSPSLLAPSSFLSLTLFLSLSLFPSLLNKVFLYPHCPKREKKERTKKQFTFPVSSNSSVLSIIALPVSRWLEILITAYRERENVFVYVCLHLLFHFIHFYFSPKRMKGRLMYTVTINSAEHRTNLNVFLCVSFLSYPSGKIKNAGSFCCSELIIKNPGDFRRDFSICAGTGRVVEASPDGMKLY